MKRTLFVYLFLLMGTTLVAQRKETKPFDDEDYAKDKFFSYGITSNTNSSLIGGFVVRSSQNIGKNNGKLIQRYLAIEAVNVKSPKEKNAMERLGTKLMYGKTNYLFSIRPEYGREWYMFNKMGDKSVGLSGILAVGPSIGIQKPYYIKYIVNESIQNVQFNPDIHTDTQAFVGSAPIWTNLFKNIEFNPGVHVKGAINFDMNSFGDNVSGIEVGSTFEVFMKEPELMAAEYGSNPKAFLSAYVTLYFGNKK